VLVVLALTGCATTSYLLQAGRGQLQILTRKRDLAEAIRDPRTPARTRELLRRVASMKAFAKRRGLTPTGSYDEYADLGRPYAVWVVSACEPLRFRNKTWSFPIVGSVPYLGWFHREDAYGLASELRKQGWDVDVRGASAYSTLGWFDDPVLSTMISSGDDALGDLANTVLHESVHATLYVDGQSAFNESLASFVADRITDDYLTETLGPGSEEARAYDRGMEEGLARTVSMHEAYQRLEALFASPGSRDEKLAAKARIYAELGARVHARRPLNNAVLAQFRTYASGEAELGELFAACGRSVPRMMASLRTLRASSFPAPHTTQLREVILPLARGGCRGS
jgi:predicted aminopeptidase